MKEFGKDGILYRLKQLDDDLVSIIDEDVEVRVNFDDAEWQEFRSRVDTLIAQTGSQEPTL